MTFTAYVYGTGVETYSFSVRAVDANNVTLGSKTVVTSGSTALTQFDLEVVGNGAGSFIDFKIFANFDSGNGVRIIGLAQPTIKVEIENTSSHQQVVDTEYLQRPLYRFAFNGMERDDEIRGAGNHYNFGARVYDPRLGRWLSVDPLAYLESGWSPYRALYCNPISQVDPTGLLEDDYKVDKETGVIEKIRTTSDTDDKLFATDESGKVDEENYVQVKKGVLDKMESGTLESTKTGEKEPYQILKNLDPSNADEVFEFVSKNTDVEWTLLQGEDKATGHFDYLMTTHSHNSESYSQYLLDFWSLTYTNIETHTHDHKGHIRLPNGEIFHNDRYPSKPDQEVKKEYEKKYPSMKFKIFMPRSGKYYDYP